MIRRLLAVALLFIAEWPLVIAPARAAINAPVQPAQAAPIFASPNTWSAPQTNSGTSSGLSIRETFSNRQGGTGSAGIGFDVTSPSETATTKAGIAFTRNAIQGGGVLSLCNRGGGDAAGFTTADCFLAHDSNQGSTGTLKIGKPGDNTTLQGTVFMGPASALAVGSNNAVAAPQMFSFVQNNTSANYTYNGPMVFFERHDNTSSSTTTSNWGNSQLSPLILANIVVGPNSRNNPNVLAFQVENDNAAVAGSGGSSINATTGISGLMQCNPGAGNLCEDSFGMNFVAAYLSGNAPQNLMFFEGDMLNYKNPAGLPGNGGQCFCGFFVQSGGADGSGNPTYGSAAFYASAVQTGNGWIYGFEGVAYFMQYGLFIQNNYNNPTGGGAHIFTTYAGGGSLPILDAGTHAGSTDTSMFRVTGDGRVTLGLAGGAATIANARISSKVAAFNPNIDSSGSSVAVAANQTITLATSRGELTVTDSALGLYCHWTYYNTGVFVVANSSASCVAAKQANGAGKVALYYDTSTNLYTFQNTNGADTFFTRQDILLTSN